MATAVLPSEQHPGEAASESERLYEVLDGERVELPEMSVLSNLVKSELHFHLRSAVDPATIGRTVTETLFVLDADRDRQRRPDVAFVSLQRWPADREIPAVGEWVVVPDLAVEVTSPSDLWKDVLAKVHEYFDYGVRLVWVVAPEEQQVYVYNSPTDVTILGAEQTLDAADVVPGFALPLGLLFESQPAANA